jgi:uncharacterized protein (TIGR02266 family)
MSKRTISRTRLYERVPFGTRVDLYRSRLPVGVRARDLSAGGLFVETRERLAEGGYVTLRLSLPGQAPFTTMCRVTRVTSGRGLLVPAGAGLAFVDIAPRDRAAIRELVTTRTRRAVIAQAA